MSESVAALVTDHLRALSDTEPQRASVTFLGVEPIDVLRLVVDADGVRQLLYATVGCSRHPMGDPTDLHADPVRGPRAEIVVRMAPTSPLPGLHKRLATIAAAPAVEGLILSVDALVDLGEPLWDGSSCTALLLGDDPISDLALPDPMDPVVFLRATPITANEAAWVRLKGAAALREAWTEAGIDVADPTRSGARL
ncbi:suppressor of fused domain protein [Gordonia sp. TBRC 11910]|uniref:Suppressor of fused domain protein n=1 Tax=Gordonia asplenii TaxID=2725283 RepID=A0A848KWB7_9ACTN|nr:suppressor of fused domain protein [Gordonia asplenii]NMO01165.1 suppressor of fused domain protein [Gordonia asplenii]